MNNTTIKDIHYIINKLNNSKYSLPHTNLVRALSIYMYENNLYTNYYNSLHIKYQNIYQINLHYKIIFRYIDFNISIVILRKPESYVIIMNVTYD